jgi:type VI secretion system protein ImpL
VGVLSPYLWRVFAATIGVSLAAVGAYLLARWSFRWFLVVVALTVVVVFLFVLPAYAPSREFLEPGLPAVFLEYFWAWVLLFLAGMFVSTVVLARVLRSALPERAEVAPEEWAGRFPEIDDAWEEVRVRLGHAGIDPANQHVVAALAPHEDWAAALVRAADAPVFAQGPDADAPVHAYATAEGVLLTASGASGFGTQAADGALRAEYVGRLLRDVNPACPPARAVVVVFPIQWAGQPDSVKWAAALRDDLQALQRALAVRCPVFAVFTEMETAPGFTEFLARMPPALRQSRCGFAIPSSQAFSGDLIQRGLVWMSGWFHGWVLSLMSDDLLNPSGNQQLFCLDHEFRRYRKRLRALAEAAFSTHRETEPVMLRGCYFTATGAGPDEQAFAAGLLKGPRGRVHTEHAAACWTARAEEDDRYYRRVALVVGLVGGLLTLLGWVAILALSRDPWWAAGLGAVVVAWGVTLFRLRTW